LTLSAYSWWWWSHRRVVGRPAARGGESEVLEEGCHRSIRHRAKGGRHRRCPPSRGGGGGVVTAPKADPSFMVVDQRSSRKVGMDDNMASNAETDDQWRWKVGADASTMGTSSSILQCGHRHDGHLLQQAQAVH
jgi:hypothetical protein